MYVGDELSCAKPVEERKKIDLGASQVKGAAFPRIKRFHTVVTSFGVKVRLKGFNLSVKPFRLENEDSCNAI